MTYLDELNSVVFDRKSELSRLKLIAFDVDGVLTNGQLHYQEHGEAVKTFNVKDGVGIKLLSDVGVIVVVISAKDSLMVKSRMEDLGVIHYYPGTKNKLELLQRISSEQGLELDQCGYVGDDMVDLKPMQAVGVSISPADAYPLIRECADIILPLSGGQGVARHVCDLVLVAKEHYHEAYQLAETADFERKR